MTINRSNKNNGSFLAFTKKWFERNQKALLFLLNAPVIKIWFRWVLKIQEFDCSLQTKITNIQPNNFSYGDRLVNENGQWLIQRTTDFRSHDKFGKRIYSAFRPVWWILHFWDWVFADRFAPQWSYGFLTLTAYPDADPETTSVDGEVSTLTVLSSWATLVAASGDNANTDHIAGPVAGFTTDGVSDWFSIERSIFLFDTSALTSGATISAAVLSLSGTDKSDDNSATPNINIYTSSPASNTNLVAADYSTLGTTAQCDSPITYSSWSTSAYNDFTLNATGRGNISKTGISKFGARNASYDVANSAPPRGGSFKTSRFRANFADNSGTSTDPKLVVTYTAGTDYTKSLNDTMTIADSPSKKPGLTKTDSMSMAETSSSKPKLNKTDTVSFSDARFNAVGMRASDTMNLADSPNKLTRKTFTDSMAIADSLAKVYGLSKSETVNLADSLARIFRKNLTDNATLSDVIIKTPGKNLSDLVIVADALGKILGLNRTDTQVLSDSIIKTAILNKTDSFTILDMLVKSVRLNPADTLNLIDSLSRSTAKPLSDTLQISDLINKRSGKTLTDSMNITDSPLVLRGLVKLFSDSIAIVDSLITNFLSRIYDPIPKGIKRKLGVFSNKTDIYKKKLK